MNDEEDFPQIEDVAASLELALSVARDTHDYLLLTDGHYPSNCQHCLDIMHADAVLRQYQGFGQSYRQDAEHDEYTFSQWATQIDQVDCAADTQDNPMDYDEWVRYKIRVENE